MGRSVIIDTKFVLLRRFQLPVKFASLRLCTLALAAFLMQFGFYLSNASLQLGELLQYIVMDTLKLFNEYTSLSDLPAYLRYS